MPIHEILAALGILVVLAVIAYVDPDEGDDDDSA